MAPNLAEIDHRAYQPPPRSILREASRTGPDREGATPGTTWSRSSEAEASTANHSLLQRDRDLAKRTIRRNLRPVLMSFKPKLLVYYAYR
jgi:hypothetical protein